MNVIKNILTPMAVLLLFVCCGGHQKAASEQQESRSAKRLLQGVWMEEESETVVFRMKGDTVYYADSTSLPAYFKVVGDTLCVGSSIRYFIEKHTEHVLWFRNQSGETMKFVKSAELNSDSVSQQMTAQPTILSLTEVLKRDTVVFWDNQRYHIYVAVNPTKYKVIHHTLNEDGLDVENVYYDNIIHLSIYQGASQLFSCDFHKQFFSGKVPSAFLSQAILNDMQYSKTDAHGFHLNASLCVPDDASCYMVETTVGYDWKVTTKLLEY